MGYLLMQEESYKTLMGYFAENIVLGDGELNAEGSPLCDLATGLEVLKQAQYLTTKFKAESK